MNLKKIIALLIILLLSATVTVFAVDNNHIMLEGDDTIETGKTKTLTVKISSEKVIGVLTGKIESSSNITINNVTALNGWSLTYNKDTGDFVIYEANGAKDLEIMTIEYTAGNTKGDANIKISNINLSDIEYNDITGEDIIKEISIQEKAAEDPGENPENPGGEQPGENPNEKKLTSIEITNAPTKTVYTEGEKFDKTGMKVTAKYSDGSSKVVTNYTYEPTAALKLTDKKITISYTENGVTKTATQTIKIMEKSTNGKNNTKDNTVVEKPYPNTGLKSVMVPIIIIAVAIGISYLRYKKYKNI